MSIEDARRLVKAHKDEIAVAIRAQTTLLAPEYANIDPEARKASILNVIDALERVLNGQGKAALFRLVLDLAQLRKMTGLSEPALMISMFSYMPVVRRVFKRHEPDLATATAAFDALESWALPLMAEIVRSMFPEEDDLSEADTISDGHRRGNITPVPFDV